MSFRHEGKRTHEWKQWLEAYQADILRCGLPDSILQSRFRWVHFLDHGGDEWTGWSPSMLSRDQAQALHEFILREYGNEQYRGCLYAIEQFVAKPVA